MSDKKKCEKCGYLPSRWPLVVNNPLHLIWPIVLIAMFFGAYKGISTIVYNSNQKELRKQYLLNEMSPSWETMYYVLCKVSGTNRSVVMTEFISRAPHFFEGQSMSPEQMGLFLDLFTSSTIPEVLSYVDPTVIEQENE